MFMNVSPLQFKDIRSNIWLNKGYKSSQRETSYYCNKQYSKYYKNVHLIQLEMKLANMADIDRVGVRAT